MAVSNQEVAAFLAANPGLTDAQIAQAAQDAGVSSQQLAQVTGIPVEQIETRIRDVLPSIKPVVEERTVDMGEGTRSEYYVKGTNIAVDAPNYYEDYFSGGPLTESSAPTLQQNNVTIYDAAKGGEYVYSPEGQYLGFQEGKRDSGLGGFVKEAVVGTAPIWSAALTAGGASGALGSTLAPSLSAGAQGALGGALIGGGTAAVTGKDILKGAVLGGASGYLQGANSIGTSVETDASFLANDAATLAAQGLSETQIADILGGVGGYASGSAANLAASMAVNGLDVGLMTQQLDALSTNTGLMSQTGSAADFAAADALQLQSQVGNNFAAIEQNLIASGVDPLVAADISQQIAFNPGLTQADLATNLSNSFGNNIYDVNMATTYPTSTLPGSGGLLSDVTNINEGLTDADFLAADALQLQGQVGNNAAAIEQNLIAAGVDPLVAADVSNQVILNPGITQAELAANLGSSFGTNIFDVNTAATYPTSVLPGSGGLLSDLPATTTTTPATTPATTPPASSTGLTTSQIANLLKAGVSLASITGAASAVGGGGSTPSMQTPTQGIPTNSPEYYQQLQQYYNAYLPQTPRDVVSPLQQWYNSSYGA